MISDLDDFEDIKYIDNLEIKLILENDFNEETNPPDCYGYMRIDQTVQIN